MKFAHALAGLALGLAALPIAFAQPVSGTTAAAWNNPLPTGPAIVTTGVGTAFFTWGDSSAFGTNPNSLLFEGDSFVGVLESPFKVGKITYYNGTTAIGSTPDSVDLSLTLNFTTPALPPVVGSYLFTLNTTPNTADPDESADFVNLPSAFSSTDFLIGSTTYRVKLVGFDNIVGDGFLTSDAFQLHVREDATASADLYAIVTTQAIPEPETYALLLAGLAAVSVATRRRRRGSRK
ncbi:MAG: choice-of-anchor K domain-containing protein [Caldimonas sp.]